MGSCNLEAMISDVKKFLYKFEYLGGSDFKIDRGFGMAPTIMLIENQATVQMSKNYKVASKNRHIGWQWHFVCQDVKPKIFALKCIPAEDQLADNLTKSQDHKTSNSHFIQTLIPIPDYVKGYISNTIGNR
jgi:hypothetical protein